LRYAYGYGHEEAVSASEIVAWIAAVNASEIVALIAALCALYVAGVALTVGAGMLYCAWAARRYGGAGLGTAAGDAPALAAPRLSALSRARGLCVEVFWQAFALILRGAQELRLLRKLHGDARCTPLLVLPGYVENAGTMWWLGRRLERAGYNVYLVEFPSTTCAIEQNVAYLAAVIEQIRVNSGGARVAVVAHSMGGVITRTLMLSRQDHGVHTLVAIGSPFRGTHLARLGARLRIGHCVGQIVPGSDFLRRFPPSQPCPVPTLSLIAPQENIVTPIYSAVVAGARVHVLSDAYGHEAPLFSHSVFREVEAWLDAQGVTRASALVEPEARRAG
jgi:pimeloyl-ACP methyl ester carboxylesterase